MKHSFLLSLLTVAALYLLPTVCASAAPEPSPVPSPAPTADEDIVFTVPTDSGTETVCLRDYLPGVLAGEMPALFEQQALMAQAVAARTYIMHRTAHPSAAHPEAVICNDAACCKAYASEETLRANWGDRYDSYWARIVNAVQGTDGQYLTYDGEPIEAVFHSSSLGATEASDAIWNHRPYLISVESPEREADVPNLVTEAVFSAEELKVALSAKIPDLQFTDTPDQWLTDTVLTDSGRVDTLTVCGTAIKGTVIRSALALRSSAFTVDYADSVFTFTVSGYGHGVGMSQYGANVYAKQGWSYEEILAHYYPDTRLTTVK